MAVPIVRLNTTFVELPAAWFCALFLLQTTTREAGKQWRRSVLMALIAAALCAAKTTYLPPVVLVCVFFYLGSWRKNQSRATVAAGALWAVLTGLFLVPWMLDLHAKEGTYLFPLLGRGYDASAYGLIPLPSGSKGSSTWQGATSVLFPALPLAGPLLLAFLAIPLRRLRQPARDTADLALGSLLLSGALSVFVISSSTGGESLGRYCLPFELPALLLFLGWLLAPSAPAASTVWGWSRLATAATLLYLALLGWLFDVRLSEYRRYAEDARLRTPPSASWFDGAQETRRLQALQAAVPPGQRLMARLFVSYALDFRRNPIFLPDFTGMAGFRPGMPLDNDLCRLVEYFERNQIRYLAFDHARMLPDDYDPGVQLAALLANPGGNGRHGWLHVQMKVSHLEQQQLLRLAALYPQVYDDGFVSVVRLNYPTSRVKAHADSE